MVFPDQTNHHGTLFGGEALSMMATAGAIAATRRARRPVVLASSGTIDFHAPVPHGSIVDVAARVARVGRSSLQVEVDLDAEDLLSGDRRRSTTGRFVFVAVDELGKPVPVEAVATEGDDATSETTRTTELVLPGQTNHHGTLFGGEAMRLLDATAFVAATRHARRPLVTARSEQIDFRSPVSVGELVHVQAAVVETGRTSLVVEADAAAENPLTGERRHCTRGRFVMVTARADR